MKKVIALLTSVMLIASVFAGCAAPSESGDTFTVGVIQFGSHSSLDNCYEGVEAALKEAFGDKVVIDRQNGNFDSSACDTIAKNMVAKNYDLLIPIATPAAVSAYAAAANTDIPVIFCAVSDAVGTGLVNSNEAPGGNCTGTSDILDLASQVKLIKALQPDAKKIGVLYTTSEANSLSQLALLKEVAQKEGMEVVASGVQTSADVPQAAAALCPTVDLINNFTDNNVVNNITTVFEQASAANIPVYGSEVEQVKKGCIASMSIDYVALGKKTGSIAAEVLNGKSAAEIPVATISEAVPVVNTNVLEKFGITLPDEFSNAEKVVTSEE